MVPGDLDQAYHVAEVGGGRLMLGLTPRRNSQKPDAWGELAPLRQASSRADLSAEVLLQNSPLSEVHLPQGKEEPRVL